MRCPPSFRVLWQWRRTPPPLLLSLRALLYQLYQTRAQIAMGDCSWPVQVVKCYLDCTAPHRPRCERLSSPEDVARRSLKNTVSFWLWKTISWAYQLLGRSLPGPPLRARETRGIAPSLLFKKNFTVAQVLKAGTWRRHTTFTRHYLRDLAHRSLDTFHLLFRLFLPFPGMRITGIPWDWSSNFSIMNLLSTAQQT